MVLKVAGNSNNYTWVLIQEMDFLGSGGLIDHLQYLQSENNLSKQKARSSLLNIESVNIIASFQTGKYVVRAEDLPRANNLPCAQRPIKHAKFEKYTFQARRYLQRGTITYVFFIP